MFAKSILFILIFLTGCAGKMDGMVRRSGKKVKISYQQGIDQDYLQLKMPDGESFKGKVVMVGHSSVSGWGFTNSSPQNTYFSAFAETSTGNMQGVLFGDHKHTMYCKLHYADSSGFTPAGGIGVCKISDGRIIDIKW